MMRPDLTMDLLRAKALEVPMDEIANYLRLVEMYDKV